MAGKGGAGSPWQSVDALECPGRVLQAIGLGSHRLAQDGVAEAGHHLAAGQRLLREDLHILLARVVSQLQGQEGQDSGPTCGRFGMTCTPIEAQWAASP